MGGGFVHQPDAHTHEHQRRQILPAEQRFAVEHGAQQHVDHRVDEAKDGDAADRVVFHQQRPQDIACAADEGQIQHDHRSQRTLHMETPTHNGAQHKQCQPAHKQVQKADGKAVGLFGDRLVPRAGQGEDDSRRHHAEHAPAAAAAVVAKGADKYPGKAHGAAQRFCRGHAVRIAVDKVGKDDAQKALGAVQDAAKGTGEHRHGDVVERILRGGLPQTQRTTLCRHLAPGEMRRMSLQQDAAQQHQHTAQHEPHSCKAEDGGGVAGVDGEQAVAQLDERKG